MAKRKVDIKQVVRELHGIVRPGTTSHEISTILSTLGHHVSPTTVRSLRSWCTIHSN